MVRLASLLVVLVCLSRPAVAEELRVLPDKLDGIAPADMMHQVLMRQSREAAERAEQQYESLKTLQALLAYQARMREFFWAQLGELPERTPLEPQVVDRLQRDGYRIEKVIYQSQPRHYVTALLYLPSSAPPYPGVLVPCGHSLEGKAAETYQQACILLAKNGLAALCYDPIDQGERYSMLEPDGQPRLGNTMSHCLAGVGATLLGRNTATYRIWDGIRSLDYLASRPEIDRDRLGCTGNSGGGTLTSYLMALDERIKAAAPSCYLTNLLRLLETMGPQDAEQQIFGQLAFGLDHAEYVLIRAPRPTLICAATRDYFDIRGTWETFRRAKRFYTRMDFPQGVDLVEADAEHGFSPQLRSAAVQWMRRWLLSEDGVVTESATPAATVAELQCSPEGQVMRIAGARNVFDLNAELEARYAGQRQRIWQESDSTAALEQVRKLTGIRRLAELPEITAEKVGQIDRSGPPGASPYRIDKLILHCESGVWLPALAFVPPQPVAEAVLYLHGQGKAVDAGPGGPIEQLALGREPRIVLAVDLGSLGETNPGATTRYAPYLGPAWKEIYEAHLLNRSYLAIRAEETLQCLRFLAHYESGDAPRPVQLIALGQCGPPALHAVALEPQACHRLVLRRSLACWADVVRQPLAKDQLANVVHGALRLYDLPDLVRTLPQVTVEEPCDALDEPLAPAR